MLPENHDCHLSVVVNNVITEDGEDNGCVSIYNNGQ